MPTSAPAQTASSPDADALRLQAVLRLPAVAALAPDWRGLLERAAAVDSSGADVGAGSAVGSAVAVVAARPVQTKTAESAEAAERPPASLAELTETLHALSRLNADGDVVVAAILHDTPAWASRIAPGLETRWPSVATLLEGQRAAAQVWNLHAAHSGGRNAEGLRRLLLVMVKDLRVVPILLARQLARLHGATALAEPDRRALARLTRDIHGPLANRLGIWQLKWELEDLAFRYLEPETYQRIARMLDEKRVDRERYIEQVKRALGETLRAQGIEAEVAGRPKHITSIWKKMQKKNAPIGELYDLRAVRVMVKDIPACYAALGAVHALWLPIPSEFDDYIARPKANDYRSLHTAVVGPEGKTLEVQIRTHEMHAQAELGVAAHWRYKEGRSAPADAGLDRKIEWMRRLLESGREGDAEPGRDDAGLVGAFDSELVEDRIYTLTPQGDVVDLPVGATPLDFAYHVHTMVGHRCRGAKVDGRIVPLDYRLHSGERVEILTAKTPAPRRDWLVAANGFLASGRSRDKVRAWFHKLDRARNEQAGKELLEKELRRLSLLGADLAVVLPRFHLASIDDLYVAVALGDAGPHQVGRALLDHEREQHESQKKAAAATDPARPVATAATLPQRTASGSAFTVVGVGNLLVQIARCCQPLPGEPIAGYLTRNRGVSVHRADCAAFLRLAAGQPQRVLEVEWGRSGGSHVAQATVEAVDRRWLLKDLSNLIAKDDAHVVSIRSAPLDGRRVRVQLQLRVRDHEQLARLLGRIERLAGVEDVRRG